MALPSGTQSRRQDHPAHVALSGRGRAAVPHHRGRRGRRDRPQWPEGGVHDRQRPGGSLSEGDRRGARPHRGSGGMTTVDDIKRTPMGINWIGLGTIVRREVSRIMRVPIQAFIAPWISALLFIFIFGFLLGGRIKEIGGHRYLEFVLPGILMMNIINAAFLQSTSAIYFQRFLRFIEETLVAPLSYVEMIVGMLVCVVIRSILTALGILVIGACFGVIAVDNIFEFLFWVVAVSTIFGELGIIIGLWAKNFEQLNILNVFFIVPLSMVGGVFSTIDMMPPYLRFLYYGNPFFYWINGLRHAMIGFNEGPPLVGVVITLGLVVLLSAAPLRLYGTR